MRIERQITAMEIIKETTIGATIYNKPCARKVLWLNVNYFDTIAWKSLDQAGFALSVYPEYADKELGILQICIIDKQEEY